MHFVAENRQHGCGKINQPVYRERRVASLRKDVI